MTAPDIVKSKTTQNQLAASGGVAGMLIATVTFLRATFPALVPWPAELDIPVITLVTALLAIVPLISRQFSMWRDPDKVDRKEALEMLAGVDSLGVGVAVDGHREPLAAGVGDAVQHPL